MNMRLAVMAVAMLGATGAHAQGGGPGAEASVLNRFADCRALADNDARLACFDNAAAALSQAVERNELVILDREDVREARRSLFGFSLPRLPFFSRDADEEEEEEEFSQIDSSLTRVRALGHGKFAVTIEGGAVWRTTEAVRRQPRVGSKIRIRRGAIGSYFLSFDDARAVRGMRVN